MFFFYSQNLLASLLPISCILRKASNMEERKEGRKGGRMERDSREKERQDLGNNMYLGLPLLEFWSSVMGYS